MSKRILTLVVAAAFIFALVGVSTAKAATVEELQALIAQLQAQISALSGGSSTTGTITKDLTIGSQGDQVEILQKYLEDEGYLVMPVGVAYGYFGNLTKAAVAKWQAANGVAPAAGYFGPKSRSMYATLTAGSTAGDDDDDDDVSTGLEGGAGSIYDVDYVSKLSNEEVGEGKDDVEVAGLVIEADDNSDLELLAVNLNFSKGTATRDLDRYAEEVSIWFEDEEVARLDADEFTRRNNYDKTVSLDRGAIIRAGETGELVVALSGVSNLDSTDEGKTWTVEFESVRYRDGLGAVIDDSNTGDINDATGRTFSFEGFASASDLELRLTKGSAAINDSRIIMVSTTDETDDEEILSFKLEARGDSDLYVNDISVDFTAVGAGVSNIINTAKLVVDGDVMGSETLASSTIATTTVVFDNIDLVIDAGDTVEVVVEVDINEIGDGYFTEGDNLMASVNPDNDDAWDAWDVEDEKGNLVGNTDKTGAASSKYHAFHSTGIVIAANTISTPTIEDTNGDTAGGKIGLYTVKFDVTAFENAIYIPTGPTAATATITTNAGVIYTVEDSTGVAMMLNDAGLASTSAIYSATASKSGDYYVVDQGETETFTLQVTLTPAADGYYRVQLYGVNYNVGAADNADTMQITSPATDFETDHLYIDV
ncbi:MAG: peptidoglycan-binding protein [Candidatus Paceibacterota bacterium]|jgi:peptidoglycan hydrolase-like protein with peptidoglycan-binding domain